MLWVVNKILSNRSPRKGEAESGGSGSQMGETTYTPGNKARLEELAQAGSGFLKAGPGEGPGVDPLQNLLGDVQGYYKDIISGRPDTQALQDLQQDIATQATTAFERNVLPAIQSSAEGTGTAASSRRGIAEGIAAGDLASSIASQQTQAAYNFGQDALNRRMGAISGLGGMSSDYLNLIREQDRQSGYERNLRHLLASRDLMDVDLGGTTTSRDTSRYTGTQKAPSLF